jgi:hypothetical protein
VSETPVSTEAVMDEVRDQVRAELYARLVGHGAGDAFTSREVFDDVDQLFTAALAHEKTRTLLLAARIDPPWEPRLSLTLTSHRPGLAGRSIEFAKSRVVLPVVRWLFEYANVNFRRQQKVNIALMAVLQAVAADHARLKARVAALERRAGG